MQCVECGGDLVIDDLRGELICQRDGCRKYLPKATPAILERERFYAEKDREYRQKQERG